AIGAGGRKPDLLHLPRAQPEAAANPRRTPRRLQPRLFLDRRTDDHPLRHLGDRDPRLRLAHASRLAGRPNRDGHGTARALLLTTRASPSKVQHISRLGIMCVLLLVSSPSEQPTAAAG